MVKLFYLGAVHRWLEDKKIEETPELKRAVRDMIVDSSNEATQYIVDVLTQTTGGYELPSKEMEEWQFKRNAVNRHYTSLGYSNINVNQRTAQMMELLKRDYAGKSTDADDQGHGFTGIALQGLEGVHLWSKAGWTSTTRHDAAYLEMPGGAKFVLVTFTTDHANEREIIPVVARVVIEGIKDVK